MRLRSASGSCRCESQPCWVTKHGRLVCPQHLRHDRMKGPQPIGVGGARRKGDVHRSALGSPSADLIGEARAGKEVRRRLVQADVITRGSS